MLGGVSIKNNFESLFIKEPLKLIHQFDISQKTLSWYLSKLILSQDIISGKILIFSTKTRPMK